MGLFDQTSFGQSLIKNEEALDFEFIPKIIPFREQEQRQIVSAIHPLMHERTGRNLCVFGPPGIGKTAAAKHVLRELEEETEEVFPLYVNCWQANTTFKIYAELCDQLNFKFTHNKDAQGLFKTIEQIVNKKAAVFVFDEIDKAEEYDFIYTLLEGIYKKSVVLLTNFKEWVVGLDDRIRSRLAPQMVEFRPYNLNETREILRQRIGYAIVDGAVTPQAHARLTGMTFERKDIRYGLKLLHTAVQLAEEKGSTKVLPEHIEEAAAERLDDFTIKSRDELDAENQRILDLVKAHSGLKIGELFKRYQDAGGEASYKTFQRRIAMLGENSYLAVTKQTGAGGNTTIVERKLTEF